MVSSVKAEEALARLNENDRSAVEAFRDRVREAFGDRLRDLRLFGSKVRGDDHDESDIDLLVLISDATNDDANKVRTIAEAITIWLDPHTRDYDRYHLPISRASGFYKEMRKESVRL
jgi:predicted nucleotidyltransferase